MARKPRKYPFGGRKRVGELGVADVARILIEEGYADHVKDVRGDESYQKRGIDLTIDDGVEVKTDTYPPKNFFFEIWSNFEKGTKGWLYTSEADLICYYFIKYKVMYILPLKEIREIPLEGYKKAKVQTPTDGEYTTVGRLVPVKDVMEKCDVKEVSLKDKLSSFFPQQN